jgi:hypothetical protein
MPTLIDKPTRVEAAGNPPKRIDEYVGRVNTGEAAVSVAHMRSPAGGAEPGQTPEFDEFTVVRRGEWVRYSTPGDGGPSTFPAGQEQPPVAGRLSA